MALELAINLLYYLGIVRKQRQKRWLEKNINSFLEDFVRVVILISLHRRSPNRIRWTVSCYPKSTCFRLICGLWLIWFLGGFIVYRWYFYETWQSSLLYVFDGYFGGWPSTKTGKIQKVDMCAHTTNKQKHCDYEIIHSQKMYRVKHLPA